MVEHYRAVSKRISAEEWKRALVVLDTNVLLNLVGFPPTSRVEALVRLEEYAPRTWIPHHVAVEFYRNLHRKVAEQTRRADVIEEKFASLANEIGGLAAKSALEHVVQSSLAEAQKSLASALEAHRAEYGPDGGWPATMARIERLLDGHGDAPDQAGVDALNDSASERYRVRRPPGFCDEDKNGKFSFAGVTYESKNGDFYIWSQILVHARDREAQTVILVTDDFKADWWWRVNGARMGPHPELRWEAREAGVESLYFFSLAEFLRSSPSPHARVSEGTVETVERLSEGDRDWGGHRAALEASERYDEQYTAYLNDMAAEFSRTADIVRDAMARKNAAAADQLLGMRHLLGLDTPVKLESRGGDVVTRYRLPSDDDE